MIKTSSKQGTAAFMLRALRYRNYRLFFAGQIVSLVGTWITNTATGWLVYRLTGSPMMLGLVGFCSQLPAFILSPLAGITVDRFSRHRLLILTQTFAMLQSFTLAALTLSGHITVPWLLVLGACQGVINAFDMPCRQAFVIEMIENRNDLGNAIALNSSMFNAARLVGPAIGGLIIASAGEGWCFFIDGASYLGVLMSLFAMKVKPPARAETGPKSPLARLREGLAYAAGSVPIRSIITLLGLISLVGVPYVVLMPVFAGTVLGGGPHTLGFLITATGGGALIGALWLASRRTVLGLGRIIPLAAGAFGAGLILFSFSRSLWLSLPLLVVTGCSFMVQMASCNTILQTIVDDDKRGRVMSLYIMAFMGAAPFGSLLAGSVSEKIGAPATFALCGILCIGGALWFYRRLPEIRKVVRPIYARLGIIREVASGIDTASRLSAIED